MLIFFTFDYGENKVQNESFDSTMKRRSLNGLCELEICVETYCVSWIYTAKMKEEGEEITRQLRVKDSTRVDRRVKIRYSLYTPPDLMYSFVCKQLRKYLRLN